MSEWISATRWLPKLRKGRRVRLSKRAIQNGLRGRATSNMGTVTLDPDDYWLYVRRDGLTLSERYWRGQWEIRVSEVKKNRRAEVMPATKAAGQPSSTPSDVSLRRCERCGTERRIAWKGPRNLCRSCAQKVRIR